MIHPDIRDALVIAARTRLVREEDHPEHMAALEVARQHGLCRLAPQPSTRTVGRAYSILPRGRRWLRRPRPLPVDRVLPAALAAKRREVVRGAMTAEPMTTAEIRELAAVLGVTDRRVRQIEAEIRAERAP